MLGHGSGKKKTFHWSWVQSSFMVFIPLWFCVFDDLSLMHTMIRIKAISPTLW